MPQNPICKVGVIPALPSEYWGMEMLHPAGGNSATLAVAVSKPRVELHRSDSEAPGSLFPEDSGEQENFQGQTLSSRGPSAGCCRAEVGSLGPILGSSSPWVDSVRSWEGHTVQDQGWGSSPALPLSHRVAWGWPFAVKQDLCFEGSVVCQVAWGGGRVSPPLPLPALLLGGSFSSSCLSCAHLHW